MMTVRTSLLAFTVLAMAEPSLGATCAFVEPPKLAPGTELFILAEGDSITAGVGSSGDRLSYVNRALSQIAQPRLVANTAVSQSVLGWNGANAPSNSLYARMAKDNQLVPKDKKGKAYILTILIGRNDLVGYYGGLDQYLGMLRSYATAMREARWDRIVLGTLLPSDWAPFSGVRDAFNARVRGPCWANENGFDALADFAADADLGLDAAATQKTYFADGTHPNDAGYARMAPVYAQTINRLRQ